MKYSKYAMCGLFCLTGLAVAQPTGSGVVSIVAPEAADESAQAAPVPLGAAVRTRFVVLPALDEEEMLAGTQAAGPALQIGAARPVAATSSVAQTNSALDWAALPGGELVAAINIQSPGAYGLRAGVLVESLPDGALLRVYSQEHPDAIIEHDGAEINALLALNKQAGETGAAANTWWTPEVGAGDATVEVVLPVGTAPEALRMSVPLVSHIYQNLSLPTDAEWADMPQPGTAQAESCQLDATCSTEHPVLRNAVARMLYTRPDGLSYLCTGTLLNNTRNNFVPFFLTANHCISEQSAASSLQTRWFYRSTSCDSGVARPHATRHGGATLLLATDKTDSTLLRLNERPPAGVTFAGWDENLLPIDAPIHSLHHPRGGLLKYHVGMVDNYAACESDSETTFQCQVGDANGGYYRVRMTEGAAEGGSSGSALFLGDRVVGTLWGGSHSCTALIGFNFYGRLDLFFAEGASRWLAPENAL